MSNTTQENRLLKITTPLGEDFLLINRLTATEEISSLFSFEVELLHEEEVPGYEPTVVDAKSILGQEVAVDIYQRDGTTRTLSGIVNHFSQGHRDTRFSYYHATIVPNVWVLTQTTQSRIFQHKSVPDILKEVFAKFNVSHETQGEFKPRNYCVQYRETDFDFASRLMEEEGIYYFFEHEGGKNKLIIANTPQSHPVCPSKNEISFAVKVPEDEDFITSIRKWQNDYRLQSGKVTFWDYNFQVPSNKLDATQPTLFKIAGNDQMELYDYPGGYARKFDDIDRGGGERSDVPNVFDDKTKKGEIAMQSLDSQYRVITGNGDCSSMTVGHRFKFYNHPSSEQNGQYVITSVTHEAEQNPTYVTDDDIEQPYTNSFNCIAHGAGAPQFRPLRKTPKPMVQGSQTAFVVGPAGEEIFTDKYGRVKVQFHWDRQGGSDADSSCWIRVGTLWAGKQWGVIHIPRIGQEVIVDFIEGDPDQPIIVGSIYNPQTMPPYTLPANKTQSGVKSRSSKGGDSANFNEFRFEDKKGAEEVYLHAEKNWTTMVENDNKTTVIHNRTETIGSGSDKELITIKGFREKVVEKDEKITIGKDRKRDVIGEHTTSVGKNEKNSVTQNRTDDIGDKYTLTAKTSISESAKEITITAGTKMTLVGPGGTIVIDAGGVTITGVLVKIN